MEKILATIQEEMDKGTFTPAQLARWTALLKSAEEQAKLLAQQAESLLALQNKIKLLESDNVQLMAKNNTITLRENEAAKREAELAKRDNEFARQLGSEASIKWAFEMVFKNSVARETIMRSGYNNGQSVTSSETSIKKSELDNGQTT